MTDQIWERQRLRYICKINPIRGKKDSLPTYTEASFIPMECIGDQGSLSLERSKSIKDVSSGYTYFEDGDVIVAKITPCFENGKGALATKLINEIAFGTTELHILRPSASTVGKFIYYLTCSEDFRRTGEAWMYGAGGQKRVPEDFVKDYSLLLPPPYIQKIIASYLDKETTRIDALIEKKQRQIELLKEKRQAIITRAVTKGLDPNAKMKNSGVEWIGEIPEGWEARKFSQCVSIQEGQVNPELPENRGMLLIAPNHIESNTGRLLYEETAEEQGAESGKYYCRKGDVVYSKIRPKLSKATIAPRDSLCSADMYPMRGKLIISNKFLLVLLLSEPFTNWAVLESDRVAMPKLNRETMNDFYLPIPPKREQELIVEQIEKMNVKTFAIIDKLGESLALLQEYRSSLITATVSGQIQVAQKVEKCHT